MNEATTIPPQKQRLEWLDAMRGFTMWLVVAYHVAQVAFGQNEKNSASLPFLVLFRMPLFFFVSGFVAYSARFEWGLPSVGRKLWRKTMVQVFPALVFMSVFVILRMKQPYLEGMGLLIKSSTKGGYWFTWVLLQMYLLYYVCLFPLRTQKRRTVAVALLWGLSVFAYSTLYMPKVFTYHKDPFFQYSSMVETIRFMQFFLLGNLFHRLWPQIQQCFQSKWCMAVIVVVAFFCCADIFRWHHLRLIWTNLPRTLAMYSLMIMVVHTFWYYRDHFTKASWVGRTLQYVGTRTLDIYLLHFILMPSLPEVGKWLNAHTPNFLVEILCSMTVAIPVIACCCLVSHVLRVSPFLRFYLFGRKWSSPIPNPPT